MGWCRKVCETNNADLQRTRRFALCRQSPVFLGSADSVVVGPPLEMRPKCRNPDSAVSVRRDNQADSVVTGPPRELRPMRRNPDFVATKEEVRCFLAAEALTAK